MVAIHAGQRAGRWYGLASCGEHLLATVAASTREEALRILRGLLPKGIEAAEQASTFADETVAMLAEIEAGNEAGKRFSLSAEHVPEPLARILRTAAAIPVGYVTSYGRIAAAAGSEARVVGRVMAGNPLYPIVPCHRVVGADGALVGYRGTTSPAALEAKLARLRAEARGHPRELEVPLGEGLLRVFPVERVIEKAEQEAPRQRRLFDRPEGD